MAAVYKNTKTYNMKVYCVLNNYTSNLFNKQLEFHPNVQFIKNQEFLRLLINNFYKQAKFSQYTEEYLDESRYEIITQNFDRVTNEEIIKYMKYLCNLMYYINFEFPKRAFLLKKGSTTTQQTNINNHLFYPKKYNAETINFWMNLFLDLNKTVEIKKVNPFLQYSNFCNTYDSTIIIKDKTINWNDIKFTETGNFDYNVDRFLHKSFIESGHKTVVDYLFVIKDEYLKILNECQENVSCLRNLIQKSYISNISEITSIDKIFEILTFYHNEHYKIYKSMPHQNILPLWKTIFELFLTSNHNSLYDKPAEYTQEVDLSKFTYNKDIAKILDTYEFGIRSYIYKFMPTLIQYIVIFLTSYQYNQTIEYLPISKENVEIINNIIVEFIGNDYKKRIEYTKSIINNFSKIYFYLKQTPNPDFNNSQIIQEIKAIEDIDDSESFDFKIYYEQHKDNDNDTNYELLYHKIKLQQEIYNLISDFLYINAQSYVHSLEKNYGMINTNNKTLVFGNTFLLKKYGFRDVSYVYKLNSDVNIGLSNTIKWTVEQNNVLVINFAKTERLISGIFLINDEKIPNIYVDFINKTKDIKNLKLIEIIEISLPLAFYKKHEEAKEQSERQFYTHIYYIFFDIAKEIIVILNNRGRVVYPGEILETYAITYRELTILHTYNCNFYKCKKFNFLYLVSPAEYSERLPIILKKNNIYDKFVANFEPVFIVKDRINTKGLIIVKKNLELVSYPTTYKQLYLDLKKIGNIETHKFNDSIKEHLPFHSQVCS